MARKIAYWASTGIIAVLSLFAVFSYLSGSPQAVAGFAHVGYPQQLPIILGAAKLPGVIALLVPGFVTLKEWAYAGFTFAWICAAIAHSRCTSERKRGQLLCFSCSSPFRTARAQRASDGARLSGARALLVGDIARGGVP